MPDLPQAILCEVDGIGASYSREVAKLATKLARQQAPKLTGASAKRIFPISDNGYFGVGWKDQFLWYQENGIRPFTMNNLSGVIPMWVTDDGSEGPKAKRRTTADGRRQVLIFRFAASKGSRKNILRKGKMTSVPRSYPGAPGRIAKRHSGASEDLPEGRKPGQIAPTNVGVRWRHPGLNGRHFLLGGLMSAAQAYGYEPSKVVIQYASGHYESLSPINMKVWYSEPCLLTQRSRPSPSHLRAWSLLRLRAAATCEGSSLRS